MRGHEKLMVLVNYMSQWGQWMIRVELPEELQRKAKRECHKDTCLNQVIGDIVFIGNDMSKFGPLGQVTR